MVQTFLRNVWRDFRLPMSSLATVKRKSFNGKFAAKIDFPTCILCYIADADIGSLKSLHTLFDKYLDHMLVKFEQNRMVRTIQNFVLFDKKWLTIFNKVLTPFWKTFLWLKQLFDAKMLIQRLIFQCSKNYGTPRRVTRLKVAPNMADAISLNENLPQP